MEGDAIPFVLFCFVLGLLLSGLGLKLIFFDLFDFCLIRLGFDCVGDADHRLASAFFFCWVLFCLFLDCVFLFFLEAKGVGWRFQRGRDHGIDPPNHPLSSLTEMKDLCLWRSAVGFLFLCVFVCLCICYSHRRDYRCRCFLSLSLLEILLLLLLLEKVGQPPLFVVVRGICLLAPRLSMCHDFFSLDLRFSAWNADSNGKAGSFLSSCKGPWSFPAEFPLVRSDFAFLLGVAVMLAFFPCAVEEDRRAGVVL